jgi:hypothetical protein
MFTSSLVLASVLLADTASAHKEKGNDWDAAAAKAIDAKVHAMFKAFDTGDVGPFVSGLDGVAITWDVGVEGEPLAANTREETQKLLEGYATWMKESGVTVKTTIHRSDCHSTASVGFCALEFDQVFTEKGEQSMQQFRATLVARMVDGEWRWAHWHASPREATGMHHDTPPTP